MPIYDYRCSDCGEVLTRYEPMAGSHEIAICACGNTAVRIWDKPMAFVDNTPAHYNYGLGIQVNSRKDIREAQRRYKGEHGSELVEVGNEKPTAGKRVRAEYASAREIGY